MTSWNFSILTYFVYGNTDEQEEKTESIVLTAQNRMYSIDGQIISLTFTLLLFIGFLIQFFCKITPTYH